MEIWKDIPGYEGLYQISLEGKIRTLNYNRTGRIQELKTNVFGGYLSLPLNNKQGRKLFRVHVLMAMTFLGHVPGGHIFEVDHKNDNPLDNRLENLQIITHRKNISKSSKLKRNLPTGVVYYNYNNNDKFVAKCRVGKKIVHLGYYKTSEEASEAYQKHLKLIEKL